VIWQPSTLHTARSTAGTPPSLTTSKETALGLRAFKFTPPDPPTRKRPPMRSSIIHAPGDIRRARPRRTILEPIDAAVRTGATCVCWSDLALPRPL
jgi:hypothetical protein